MLDMAKGKGGGGKSRSDSRPSYRANKPAKTSGKSGSGRSNNTQAKPSSERLSSEITEQEHRDGRILQQPEPRNSLARYFIAQERRKGTVMKEVDDYGLYTECLYFLKLPVGDVIKIGTTTIRRLYNRIRAAQTYFVDDVECLGIEYFYDRREANKKERNLKHQFGTAHPHSDLILDSMDVHQYIMNYCTDASADIAFSKEAEQSANRK